MIDRRAFASVGSYAAAAPAAMLHPLAGVDIGDDRRLLRHRAGKHQSHHADATQADEQHRRPVRRVRNGFERRISGKAERVGGSRETGVSG